MSSELWLIVVLMLAGFGSVLAYVHFVLGRRQDPVNMEDTINKVFGMSAQKISEQSKQILEGERQAISVDLENKQKAMEKLVKQLQDDMKTRQDEIRLLEQDRSKKFSEITTVLEQHRHLTERLEVSTQQLSRVLSNNQTRGAWGEKIIEELLLSGGLLEGRHYLKQTPLGNSTLRPDITLLLPNKRVVPVDAKFPYSEIVKMTEAEGKEAKQLHLKQFEADFRAQIKKVAGYIHPDYETLDYAILFVPNEMIFSFINQKFPELMDEAMAQRVIIVSPFTFLIVARTVIESYRNFMMEDRLKEVVKYVDSFVKEWSLFRDEFDKFGRSIETLSSGYEKLSTTRTVQMERRIRKIAEYQSGQLAAVSKDAAELPLPLELE